MEMTGFAPVCLGRAGRVGRALLVTESDAESGHRLAHFQAVVDGAQFVVGGGEEVRAGCHDRECARVRRVSQSHRTLDEGVGARGPGRALPWAGGRDIFCRKEGQPYTE